MKYFKGKLKFKEYILKVAEDEKKDITSPAIVVEIMKEDFSPVNESMHILILNIKNQIIEKYLVAKGNYNTLLIKPIDIIRPVIMTAGNNIIIVHNHPSGDSSPSEEDINFTKKMKKGCDVVGINILDHVIYTDENHYSFKKNELL